MNKEEAIEKLRRAESDLREAEIVIEMHENSVRELREDIKNLKVIIKEKDDWKSVEVPDVWHLLYLEKTTLMAEMIRFAYIKNDGWVPDWSDKSVTKFGIVHSTYKRFTGSCRWGCNDFVFGIAVKSEEIAQEMLEEFGKRIEEVYNKQY